jgi:hypothetical protein
VSPGSREERVCPSCGTTVVVRDDPSFRDASIGRKLLYALAYLKTLAMFAFGCFLLMQLFSPAKHEAPGTPLSPGNPTPAPALASAPLLPAGAPVPNQLQRGGRPNDPAATGETRPQHPTPDPSVQAIQARLKALGFYAGAVDGLAGPRTRSAIAAFQRANGLPVDGSANRELLSIANTASNRPPKVVKLTPEPPVRRTEPTRQEAPKDIAADDAGLNFWQLQAVEERCATEKYVYRGLGYKECRAAAIRSVRQQR